MIRIAAVLWSGALGGAETFTADLCANLRELGSDVQVVFVANSEPLGRRLAEAGVPYTSLGLVRGREVIRRRRFFAQVLRRLGPHGVLLPRGGYLAASLRAGGYHGRIVAVAHDALLELGPVSPVERLVRRIDRASGRWATDIDVAVSDFVLAHIRRRRLSSRSIRIYNGVDLERYAPASEMNRNSAVTVACAGRLVTGKGVDVLLRAFAAGLAEERVRLRIAGGGPALPMLRSLVRELGLGDVVEFMGPVLDMPTFWRRCDVAVQPSHTVVESFGMATVEAMACNKPVVVTSNGALPELVEDGVTGAVVPAGDVGPLTDALLALTRDADKRQAAGHAARARCERLFDIRDCATSYVRLLGSGS